MAMFGFIVLVILALIFTVKGAMIALYGLGLGQMFGLWVPCVVGVVMVVAGVSVGYVAYAHSPFSVVINH